MTRRAVFLVLTLAAAMSAGWACSGQPSASASAPDSTTPAPAAQPGTPADGSGRTITGTVVETMNAASYTYVLVDTGTEKVWAAASEFSVAVGDRVVVPLEMPMENFHSQSLNRDFPIIYFASQITREGAQPATASAPSSMAPMSSHPPRTDVPAVTETIEPAEGGKTVAAVWTERQALAGKRVTVRGKVVKFNGGIMGRNWVHIQDGTGSADGKTNDLTITTDGSVKVGDVITVTGTVGVDKDFGAGYAYPVILEDAAIRPS